MVGINVNLKNSGAMAFFGLVIIMGTWAAVSLVQSDHLGIIEAGLALAILYTMCGAALMHIWEWT